MYRYETDGLNVSLLSGYEETRTKYGTAVCFRDIEGLGVAICSVLIRLPRRLSRSEFRYLRKTCDFSQEDLAGLLGVTEQTVSLWERGVSKLPQAEDAILRVLASAQLGISELCIRDALLYAAKDVEGQEDEIVFAYQGAWQHAGTGIAVKHLAYSHKPSSPVPSGAFISKFFVMASSMDSDQVKQRATLTYRAPATAIEGPYALEARVA
jgi:putative transcriptional regulator